MSCRDVQETLSALVDHEVTAAERATAEAHLSQCSRCRSARSTLDALRAGTRRLERSAAPATLRTHVLQLTREDVAAASPSVAARIASWLRAPLVRPAAVGLLVMMALGIGTANIVRTKVVQPRVRLARQIVADVQAHASEDLDIVASDPVEISAYFGDREPVKALVESVPLAGVDGHLVGGSISDVCDQRAARIAFRDARDNAVSVYVLRAADQPTGWGKRTVYHGGAYQVAAIKGDAVVTWVGGRARYAVITAASTDGALALADELRSAFED